MIDENLLKKCNFHVTILLFLTITITITISLSPSFLDIGECSLHFFFLFSTTQG